mmetsp:Transcript_16127/g.45159  ORF Transcript_16127/g.45159 Transcript_16127/m.45159 type:complete len:800 (-) Transcript_16127:145-2544(-)
MPPLFASLSITSNHSNAGTGTGTGTGTGGSMATTTAPNRSNSTASTTKSSSSVVKPKTCRINIDLSANTTNLIPSWREYNSKRIRSIWYQDEDYEDMMNDNDRVLQRMVQGEKFSPNDDRVCGRGLENQLPERNEKRQLHKRSVVKTVLLEQSILLKKATKRKKKLLRRGSNDTDDDDSKIKRGSNHKDDENSSPYRAEYEFTEADNDLLLGIAAVASKATKRAREHAKNMGAQDAKIVNVMWSTTGRSNAKKPFTRSAPGRTVSAMARSKKTVAAQEAAALAIMGQVAMSSKGKLGNAAGTSKGNQLKMMKRPQLKKKAHFAPRVAARKVSHLNDMSDSEVRAIWFQPDELKRMKTDRKRSLHHFMATSSSKASSRGRNDAEDTDEFCSRGTECIREKDIRNSYKTKVWRAVLSEQARQRGEKVDDDCATSSSAPTASISDDDDDDDYDDVDEAHVRSPSKKRNLPNPNLPPDERIRQVSIAITQMLVEEGIAVGRADERAVYGRFKNKNINKSLRPRPPSPIRSKRRLMDKHGAGDQNDDGGKDVSAAAARGTGDGKPSRSFTPPKRAKSSVSKSKSDAAVAKPKRSLTPPTRSKSTSSASNDDVGDAPASRPQRSFTPPRRTKSNLSAMAGVSAGNSDRGAGNSDRGAGSGGKPPRTFAPPRRAKSNIVKGNGDNSSTVAVPRSPRSFTPPQRAKSSISKSTGNNSSNNDDDDTNNTSGRPPRSFAPPRRTKSNTSSRHQKPPALNMKRFRRKRNDSDDSADSVISSASSASSCSRRSSSCIKKRQESSKKQTSKE